MKESRLQSEQYNGSNSQPPNRICLMCDNRNKGKEAIPTDPICMASKFPTTEGYCPHYYVTRSGLKHWLPLLTVPTE